MSNLKKSIRKSLVVGGFCMMSSLAMSAQISLTLENKSTRDVIREIERVSEYRFFYNEDLQGLDQKININTSDANIQTVLNEIQRQTSISYVIKENNQIVLSAGVKSNKTQQVGDKRVVKGTVVDAMGDPIIGANIVVKGTTTGTITDMDGNFSLEVSAGTVLEVTYIGYTNQEIKVGNQKTLSIAMKEDSQALDEVVVIGYGTTKRKDFTGSVSSVKMENSPVALASNSNALEALKGNVTGLDIGATNSAGGQPSMQIRGQNSISGSNDPLVVVDGVIFLGNLNDINPNDIASYDVLKDATSAAAYGSRSANGVIMITTKKGKTGKPVINFSATGSMQTWHLKPELMNGEQWLDAIMAANNYSNYDFLTPQEALNVEAGNYINWFDEISRTGWMQDYQASISGAGEKMNYYMSASYTGNKGIIKGDDFNRTTVLAKINTDITDWLQVGLDASYTHSDYSGVAASTWGAVTITPYGMKYRPNGELEAIVGNVRGSNPLWGIDDESKHENVDYRDNLRANAYVLVKCPWIKGLDYRLNFSGNMNSRKEGDFIHESYYVPSGSYDDDSRYSVATQNSYLSSANGYINDEWTKSYVMDHILSYNQLFGKHNISITAVATRDLKKFESQKLKGSDFAANGNTVLGLNGLHYATTQKLELKNWKLTNVGYFARTSYSFDDTYYVTGSYRRDGASVFGAENKWGNFGAVGLAWRITNENFMKKVNFLDDMKLKLSWGKNGNQGLDQYSTLSQVANGQTGGVYYPFGNTGKPSYGINQTSIGNVELGWETTDAWNMGFESAWLNNRLFFDIDVYFSKTYDQIFSRTIPIMTGFKTMFSSMGEVKNRGVEATVRSVNIQNKDFTWSTSVTFWLNRNKLIHLYGEDLDKDGKEDDDIGNNLFIGKSIHSIYGYEQDGIVQTSDTEYMAANGVPAGNPKYVDQNGDGIINTEDRVILGCTDPNYKINMGNTLKYKNFELYFMLAGVFGGNGYFQQSNTAAYITAGDRSQFGSNGLYIPYWTEDNPSNKYPSATFTGDGYFLGLQNRTYVRLQDVTLSYTFDQKKLQKYNINNLKIFLTGKNLATITGWDGGDPEIGSTLFSWDYPVMTSISLGLNMSF